MSARCILPLLMGVLTLCWAANAGADTFIVRGVRLTTPEKGWGFQEQGPVSYLVQDGEDARIEVFRVKQVPAAETKAFAKWLRELKTKQPAEMEIANASAHEQNGLKGVIAEGTAKDDAGKALRLRILVLPVGENAVVARAIVRAEGPAELQQEVDEILKTMRPK